LAKDASNPEGKTAMPDPFACIPARAGIQSNMKSMA
jgi:hypothetical protein